jgi:hypothetical protein
LSSWARGHWSGSVNSVKGCLAAHRFMGAARWITARTAFRRGGGREVPAQEPFSAPETICTFCTGGHAKESRANLPVFTGKFPFCA